LTKKREGTIKYLDYSGLFVCGLLFNPLAYMNALVLLIVPGFFILRFLFMNPWKNHTSGRLPACFWQVWFYYFGMTGSFLRTNGLFMSF
jgi:hypothetical protein